MEGSMGKRVKTEDLEYPDDIESMTEEERNAFGRKLSEKAIWSERSSFDGLKDPEGMQRWLDEYDRIACRKMH
jgi:hypothetical protein